MHTETNPNLRKLAIKKLYQLHQRIIIQDQWK